MSQPAASPDDAIKPTSPSSNHSISDSSSLSPEFITSATYKKPTKKHVTQLSTSSPAGIAIANQVTPERLAKLLSVTGPLAIRHITSNLSRQIQGFEKLSLSKQRRLIMSCLNQGFEQDSIIFEKIGWGQWSCKHVDPKDFIKERNRIRIANDKVKDSDGGAPHANGSKTTTTNTSSTNNDKLRRESITRNKYDSDHHDKFLNKQSSGRLPNLDKSSNSDDYAILSDDEDSSGSDFHDGEDDEDEEDELFKFEDEESIPPLKLNRLTSPPISTSIGPTPRSRRTSRSSKVLKVPIVKNKRSNSQTPTSPELLYFNGNNSTSTTTSRRHSSIRSTLNEGSLHTLNLLQSTSTSNNSHNNNNYTTSSRTIQSSTSNLTSPNIVPTTTTTSTQKKSITSIGPENIMIDQEMNDVVNSSSLEEDITDEEDWESIGALKLLKSQVFDHNNRHGIVESLKKDEEDAAFALVNLRSY